MSTLTDQTVATTYQGIARWHGDANTGALTNNNLYPMQDGLGNMLPISITRRDTTTTTAPTDNTDAANIVIGTNGVTTESLQSTNTFEITINSVRMLTSIADEYTVLSSNMIDLDAQNGFLATGTLQLSGQKTSSSNYQIDRIGIEDEVQETFAGEIEGSMEEEGGWFDTEESDRAIDLAGSLLPQYTGTYRIGNSVRAWRDIYLKTNSNNTSPEDNKTTGVVFKIGSRDVGESTTNMCRLGIEPTTNTLHYDNSNGFSDPQSSNEIAVMNYSELNGDNNPLQSAGGNVEIPKTMTVLVEIPDTSRTSKYQLQDLAPGVTQTLIFTNLTQREVVTIETDTVLLLPPTGETFFNQILTTRADDISIDSGAGKNNVTTITLYRLPSGWVVTSTIGGTIDFQTN